MSNEGTLALIKLLDAVEGDPFVCKPFQRAIARGIDVRVKKELASPQPNTIKLLVKLIPKYQRASEPRLDLVKSLEAWLVQPETTSPELLRTIIEILIACGALLSANREASERLDGILQKLRQMLIRGLGTVEQRSLALYILELQACEWRVSKEDSA